MTQYVYGKNMVMSLLKAKKEISLLYVQSGRLNDDVEFLAKKQNVTLKHLSRKEMDKIVDGNHQGYIAEIAQQYKYYEINEIVDSIPEGKLPLIIALDQLEDPHNLGAILRTAACVGADGVIIEKNRSVSLNSTVAKVSCGAIETVKVAQVTNLNQTLASLKEKGYWVVGTDINKATDYRLVKYDMPLVVIIGSEGKGMRRLVKENCDINVTLPMEGNIGSLNASVAAGILLYQIYGQRNPAK